MRHFKLYILCISAVLFALSCTQRSIDPNKAAFVTLLGNDTLVVEQFEQSDTGITAQVVIRTPRTSFHTYELVTDENGGIASFTRTDFAPSDGFSGEGEVVQSVQKAGDSLAIEIQRNGETIARAAPYEAGALPFIDMVHWPFELALNRAVETGRDSVSQPLLTGTRLSPFVIAKIRPDSMTIRHPFRGVMGVDVNYNGDLVFLDAGLTTRKLKVRRVPSVDIDAIGQRFAAMDRAGNSFGSLSGAESADFSFKNTDFHVEYGTPEKRGRKIFGGIVPWGERWRTGANRATHFSTSSDLAIGDLVVPAGEYTLFTIPEPDGGTLMINRQTGQNGQSYDASRDLGRVPMQIRERDEVTERFTILVEETEEGGMFKLIWDRTEFYVPFRIR